jgi:hypothetical protein
VSLAAGIIQQLFKKFFCIELKINVPYSLGADVMLWTDGRTDPIFILKFSNLCCKKIRKEMFISAPSLKPNPYNAQLKPFKV